MYKLYIGAFLVVLCLGLGYTSYRFKGQIGILETKLDVANEALVVAQEAAKKQEESCKITDNVIVESNKDKELTESIERKLIDSLYSPVKKPIKPRSHSEVAGNDIQPKKGVTEPSIGIFSDNAFSVLTEAYCASSESDPYCSSGKP